MECVSYFVPDIDNFWHAQSMVMLIGQRLPLHIILVCESKRHILATFIATCYKFFKSNDNFWHILSVIMLIGQRLSLYTIMGATPLAEMADSALWFRQDGGKMMIFRQVKSVC